MTGYTASVLLPIPRSSLVLLIGVAGSGKSTFAARHFRTTQVLSSDACRALVSDDEADQEATQDAFEILHLILEKRLQRGKLTVVDATNVQAWARASLLAIAQRCEVPAVAIVFNLPEALTAEQNQARANRVVDANVIAQQTTDLQRSLLDLPQEGFAQVYLLTSREAVNAAEISHI